MQTQKMSLANITGKLSRAEMKNIMAGSSDGCGGAACGGGGNYTCSMTINGCACPEKGGVC